jgi:hypothetical protein
MVEVECPTDGCDYTGRVESVEAHISGSQSDGHRGEFGADRRAELVERAEEKLNGDDEPMESGDVTGTNDRGDTSSTGSMDGDETATSVESKMSPSKALIGASVLFALAAFTGSGAGTTADADQDAEPDGGLIG